MIPTSSRLNRLKMIGSSAKLLLYSLAVFILFTGYCFPQQGWKPDYDNRDAWQLPERILDAIGVGPGKIVADVGAGDGYFTFKSARRVGPQGKVFATEIRGFLLKMIEKEARAAGFSNIEYILGTESEPGLPEGQVDIVLMVHVFHIIIQEQDPLAFLSNLKSCLKPGGIVALVQWDGEKMGYPDVEAYHLEKNLEIIRKSPFEVDRVETFLPRESLIILRLKPHEKPEEES